MHRDENLNYLRENKIRTGDLVRIDGVFMAESKTAASYYIKVYSLCLLSGSLNGYIKKRKASDIDSGMSKLCDRCASGFFSKIEERLQRKLRDAKPYASDEISVKQNTGLYTEFLGSFSEYFFMLYGKLSFVATTVTQQLAHSPVAIETNDAEKEKMLNIMTKIYNIFGDLTDHGLNDLNLNSFVNAITELTQNINQLKQMSNIQVPMGLAIDNSVPLPSTIYHNFIKD
ncbi:hypothetical protein G6F37_007401 [Rhizopus arrhizus]|nr:hypothetical protein G6F38_007543 [Rhizopus arrhizus]KAG1156666.1 hypothetical protein G6F37_007401 [Rhizopus arrhizus]